LLSINAVMETSSPGITSDRLPVAAGRFYPADKITLTKDLAELFRNCKKSPGDRRLQAIISPHAGYIFSGKIAASAFSEIPKNALYKNIFVIGSSHVMSFDGASVYNTGDYITPLGTIRVNSEIANKLINENTVFRFPTNSHLQEHSIEVQLPFIQYYFEEEPLIVPIIIGTNNESTIRKIAEALKPWFSHDNLFIISSDFSHYPPYKDAVENDKATAESIASCDPVIFLHTLRKNASKRIPGLATSMCGWTSGLTLLFLAQGQNQLEIKLLDYCNSGDSPFGNKDEVVGYNAMAVVFKGQKAEITIESDYKFSFTEKEKYMLFDLARNSISSAFTGSKRISTDDLSVTPNLKTPLGAFVTLKVDGVLRGCIGRFITEEPLYRVVEDSAFSSAFEDPRFSPLTKKEFAKAGIEITVIGPLKKINNINEIILGKHGIYIKKDSSSGTMLPQVATENGWTVEEFLGYTSRDKAGIGWTGWKEAEVFIYEGIVLEDNRK
jgi:MEMO1 family protein